MLAEPDRVVCFFMIFIYICGEKKNASQCKQDFEAS